LKSELLRRNQSQRKATQETRCFILWFGQVTLAYFHVMASQWTRVALNPFHVIQWSTWIPRSFSLEFFSRLRGISTSWSLSPLQYWSQEKHKSKGGKATHARLNTQQTHTHTHNPRLGHKNTVHEFSTRKVLRSLTQRFKCVAAESRCLRLFRECLVWCSMRLGIPFIAPRQLGVVGDPIGRQFLPSIGWCTGHEQFLSGAWSPSFFGESGCWVFGLVGAPDTVRCTPDSPVWPSDRWLGHVSPVDRADDHWPRVPFGSPDSPVNYSRGAFAFSRERRVRRRASLGTGHCPVHHRLVLFWPNSAKTPPIWFQFSWQCF
jgi:hypothetical protein